MWAHLTSACINVPVLLPIPASCWCAPREAAGDGPGRWIPATRMADLDWDLGSWLQFSPVPAVAGKWGVNQQTEDLCLTLTHSIFQTKWNQIKNFKNISTWQLLIHNVSFMSCTQTPVIKKCINPLPHGIIKKNDFIKLLLFVTSFKVTDKGKNLAEQQQ